MEKNSSKNWRLFALMVECVRKINQKAEDITKTKSITGAQFFILSLIIKNPNITQTEIVKKMNSSRANVSQILKKMEAAQFINRDKPLSVTEKGIDSYEKIKPSHDAFFDEIFKTLDEEEKKQLLHILEKIYNNS